MEALCSASNKLSGASGWTEAAGVTVLPFVRRGRRPDSGTTAGSDMESGAKSGRTPCGASGASPGWVPSWDPTSASSVSRGVEAVGTEFTSDGANDPLDEAGRSSLADYRQHAASE